MDSVLDEIDRRVSERLAQRTPSRREKLRRARQDGIAPESFLVNPKLNKQTARKKLRHAVGAGWVQKPELCPCGAPVDHAHHPDYRKPLDVEWLCSKCHGERHRKTHCAQGHPFDEANTIVTTDGKRKCKTCAYAHNRAWSEKKRLLKSPLSNRQSVPFTQPSRDGTITL